MVEVARGRVRRRHLAVNPERFNAFGQRRVIGNDRAAISVTTERLGREKAGRRDIGPIRRVLAIQRAAIALRRVGDQFQAKLVTNRFDFRVVRRLPKQVHRDDHFRVQLAGRFHGRDLCPQRGRVHVVGRRVNIHENGRGAEPWHDLRRRNEGEARAKHGVAGLQFPCHQCKGEGVRPIGAADRVAGAAPGGKLFFKFSHFGAEDIAAAFDNTLNGRIYF